MRLIQQYSLSFSRAGSSKVKVFEIDLCEVGTGRFVVNYRYGRQGHPLRDGTRTLSPVERAEAEQTLDRLLNDKMRSGYQITDQYPPAGAVPPAPDAAPAPVAPAPIAPAASHQPSPTWTPDARPRSGPDVSAATSREQAILMWLDWHRSPPAGVQPKWPLHRVAWRAGELRLADAAPRLVPLLSGEHGPDYAIAWALGRCGGPDAVAALQGLAAHDSPSVQNIATSGLAQALSDSTRVGWSSALIERLPSAIQSALGSDLLTAILTHRPEDPAGLLFLLYATGQPSVRAALLGLPASLDTSRAADIAALKALLQLAEHHDDVALLIAVLARLEAGGVALKAAARTRLLERPWRVLRRMQDDGDPGWPAAAAAVLRALSDARHPHAARPGRLVDHIRRLAGAIPLDSAALDLLTSARSQAVIDALSARLQPPDPDPAFLQSLLSAGHPRVRAAGLSALGVVDGQRIQGWISERCEQLLTQTALLAACISHPAPAVRSAARDLLLRSALDAAARSALAAAVLSVLIEGEADEAAASDAVQTLQLALPTALRDLPKSTIIALVRSDHAALQGLGGAQLLSWTSIPGDLLDRLLASPHQDARAAGIRLLRRLSDGLLLEHEAAILALCSDTDPVVRQGGAALLGRLLSTGSGARIAGDLMKVDAMNGANP